jgi:hypothetical protein
MIDPEAIRRARVEPSALLHAADAALNRIVNEDFVQDLVSVRDVLDRLG